MIWTVVWLQSSMDAVAEAWLQHPSLRSDITRACHEIDRKLSTTPLESGASLAEGLLILDIFPLRVVYSVSTADRRVEVDAIRLVLK
jgi:hypothetical protein